MTQIQRVQTVFGGSPPPPLSDPVVLSRLDDLCAALRNESIDPDRLSDEEFRRLALLVWQSPHLTQLALGDVRGLASLIHEGNLEERRTCADYGRILNLRIDSPSEEFDRQVHLIHSRELLRLAWRHICDLAEIDQLMQELSSLADHTVRVVVQHQLRETSLQYGLPLTEDRAEAAMAVLAMGKLGGRELNFSSDIDILFVYRGEGKTTGGPSGQIENPVFFEKVATATCNQLTHPTASGFLYRVDTRLRPQGTRGPLVPSLEAVETYYHNWGEDWERQALLKIRPIAGDQALGEAVLRTLMPFTYRKYVDEVEIADTLRAMREIRRRMIQELPPDEQETDLKTGKGGIRDIEFIVQAVQMLYGGQYPEVRLAGTLQSLRRLHECGLLHSRDYEILSEGYRFLRRVEHRLQIDQVRQIYRLPSSPEARTDLALRLGFNCEAEFNRKHQNIRSEVRRIYTGIFGREEWEDQTEGLLDLPHLSPERRQMLIDHGLKDPEHAHQHLLSLADNVSSPHLKAKTKRLFKDLLPRLLLYLKDSPDPDMALNNMDQIIDRLGAKTTLYGIMTENPQLVELLVILTGGSRYLSEILARDPSLIEALGARDTLNESIHPDNLHARLTTIRKAYEASESLLESLGRLKNSMELIIGTRYLLGISEARESGTDLAVLADFILQEVLRITGEEMQSRYPDFHERFASRFGIVAVGKFGGHELNFASDLDLLFLYDDCEDTPEVSASEFFYRWASKISSFLHEPSPFGQLYKCDTRLRPYGKSGALCNSFSMFDRYVRESAWVWERLALTRCRPISASTEWCYQFFRTWFASLFSRPFTPDDCREVVRMRFRIEQEKGDEKLKAGPGGLVDVEFIAQTLRLKHGRENPTILNSSTTAAIQAAGELGLFPSDRARSLCESYRYLRDIENRLQIVDRVSVDRLPEDTESLDRLAKRCFPPAAQRRLTGEQLALEVESHTRRIREIFCEFFGL
ncbi:MAG TPA: bifunctional [glutamate--ammonia ligase]-adenylyl-L-tyrosine phosphorylase/[glutamate--ammonia-ligase] adenylyltransferase [bacterium]|nr:bifunctional [glutamate--ammonia ligase]-adenylyl-L-tyrosine phosphorylase/[glutamate--ammonia-ligase] adenylyltransferase [bacterium]